MTCAPRKQSKTYKVPKRPYEAARLDAELKVGSLFRRRIYRQSRLGRAGILGYGRLHRIREADKQATMVRDWTLEEFWGLGERT